MKGLKKQFDHAVESETRLIADLFKKVSPRFGEKTIHKLRTTIKKLRALLRWQDAAGKVFTKYTKKLYRIAGEIRDAQVLLKNIRRNDDIPPAFSSWLTDRIKQGQHKWKEEFDKQKIEKWESEVLEQKQSIKRKTPLGFYKEKIAQLQENNSITPVNDETIHSERKAIKDMQYVAEWYEKHVASRKERPAATELKDMGKKAGDYMDKFNAIRSLNCYLRNEKDAEAAVAGRLLRQRWQRQKRIEKRELLKQTSSFSI